MSNDRNNAVLSVEVQPDTSLVVAAEIERLRGLIDDYRAGRLEPDRFRRARLQNGIYGIRHEVDRHMIRIKVPFGRLVAAQLDALGRAAQYYASGFGHVTTRQDVQLYRVPLERVADLLADLAVVGLTTRETSGNVVRNVTADPLAGVAPDEVFDVRPHANAVARFWLRHPLAQNMPRKFKIAFSGSPADRAAVAIHDLGALATIREVQGRPQRGFQLFVGGGLGASPRAAPLLEDFTPEDELLPTLEAIIRVFDRRGNRESRAHSRLKFLVEQIGLEPFRQLVIQERQVLQLIGSEPYPAITAEPVQIGWSVSPTGTAAQSPNGIRDSAYRRWRASNTGRQKQPGFAFAYVTLPGGDVAAAQWHGLAQIARQFAQGELFTTATQNLVLRWVPEEALHELYVTLTALDLATAGAHELGDAVSCPGTDSCLSAITASHRLALKLARRWAERDDLNGAADLRGVDVKISGCPNSCGRHHVAAIGLQGAMRKIQGQQVPHYVLLVGGRVRGAQVVFGKPVTALPAKNIPAAIERLIALYRSGRSASETFHDWIDRIGAASLKDQFRDLQTAPDEAGLAELRVDWGQSEAFTVQAGVGECAA